MRKQLGVNFAAKSEEKQSPSVAIFSQTIRMKTEKNKVFSSVYAVVTRLIEMKTVAKWFNCTILLFVALLCYIICFIVRFMFFVIYLTATFK